MEPGWRYIDFGHGGGCCGLEGFGQMRGLKAGCGMKMRGILVGVLLEGRCTGDGGSFRVLYQTREMDACRVHRMSFL